MSVLPLSFSSVPQALCAQLAKLQLDVLTNSLSKAHFFLGTSVFLYKYNLTNNAALATYFSMLNRDTHNQRNSHHSKSPHLKPQPPRPLKLPLLPKPLPLLQPRLNHPLRLRHPPHLLPHPLKTLNIMPPQNPPTRDRNPLRIAHQTPHLHAHHQAPRLRLQQLRHPHTNLYTRLEIEMMQKQAHVHDIHLAVQTAQGQIPLVEDIGWEKCALQALPVAEEVVAELHELAVEVRAVDVFAARAVGDELPHVLREAAAEIEEGLVGVAQARDE